MPTRLRFNSSDPGGGKTKKAYLWAYRSNGLGQGPPVVVFDYQASREGKHAAGFLHGWRGHLMVDDYAGYKALFHDGTVIELGCWAHARRKFFDLAKANNGPVAARALRHIARLYHIEAKAKDKTVGERKRLRAKHSRPRLRLSHAWLLKVRAQAPNGSGTAKAMDYALERRDARPATPRPATFPWTTTPSRTTSAPLPSAGIMLGPKLCWVALGGGIVNFSSLLKCPAGLGRGTLTDTPAQPVCSRTLHNFTGLQERPTSCLSPGSVRL